MSQVTRTIEPSIRLKLQTVIIKHDQMEAKKRFYNPYALGLYCEALNRLDRYYALGYDLRLCLLNCFNGRLLDKMLKAANLPVSTREECFVGGYQQLPELD